jgi:hypothetical protein
LWRVVVETARDPDIDRLTDAQRDSGPFPHPLAGTDGVAERDTEWDGDPDIE